MKISGIQKRAARRNRNTSTVDLNLAQRMTAEVRRAAE